MKCVHAILVLSAICLILALWPGPAGSAAGKSIDACVVWVRDRDESLWVTRFPSTTPTKLFGSGVDPRWFLISSRDGKTIAASDFYNDNRAYLFDIDRPGTRRTPSRFDEQTMIWLGEITLDGKGVLVMKHRPDEEEATQLGTYALPLDGSPKLIVPPAKRDLFQAETASFSPDGSRLAILSSTWLQVVESKTGKTLYFREDETNDPSMVVTWLDNHRFVYGDDGVPVHYVDIDKRVYAADWIPGMTVAALAFSKRANRVYAIPAYGAALHGLYSIDPSNRKSAKVSIPGFDVTPGGRCLSLSQGGSLALLFGKASAGSSNGGGSKAVDGLWVVDIQSGDHWLVTKDAANAILVEKGSR